MCAFFDDVSLFRVLEPDPLFNGGIRKGNFAPAMPLAPEELTLINVAVGHVLLACALLEVVHELPLIGVSVMRDHLALASCPVIEKLTLVHVTVGEH